MNDNNKKPTKKKRHSLLVADQYSSIDADVKDFSEFFDYVIVYVICLNPSVIGKWLCVYNLDFLWKRLRKLIQQWKYFRILDLVVKRKDQPTSKLL